MANEQWWKDHGAWQDRARRQLSDKIGESAYSTQEMADGSDGWNWEICENGDCYGADGGAYPIHLKSAVEPMPDELR